MNVFGGIVVFTIAWWVLFFMSLPFGVRTVARPGPGHAASAPARPWLRVKVLVVTVLASIITAAFGYGLESGLIDLRPTTPLMPPQEP